MKKSLAAYIVPFVFLLFFFGQAFSTTSPWFQLDDNKTVHINIELFISSTCPHCQKADAFWHHLQTQFPQLQVHRYVINEDKAALIRFNQLLTEQKMEDFAVPSAFFCGARWVGFSSPQTTGKTLAHALDYCVHEISVHGRLTATNINVLRHWANANHFTEGLATRPSAMMYLITIALADASGPCSLFCFLGFIAFLMITPEKKKQRTAGLIYLIAIGCMHFAQQVASQHFYAWLHLMHIPAFCFGLVLFYFLLRFVKKQSVDYYYYPLALGTAILIMFYQQTCMLNWSYIFQQWLGNQAISPVLTNGYQLLYQVVYLLPYIGILFVLLWLLHSRYVVEFRSRCAGMAVVLLAVIAGCFVVSPDLLSHLGLSILTLFAAIIAANFIHRYTSRTWQ